MARHATAAAEDRIPIRAAPHTVDGTREVGAGRGHNHTPRRGGNPLVITEPDDANEQEAERVADEVVAGSTPVSVGDDSASIHRYGTGSHATMDAAPASVEQALASPGRPLEAGFRTDMEQRFGYDFSAVRVHSDPVAEQSAREVSAHAYTVGNDIVFAPGQYAPATSPGRRLLAHEMAHVVQQDTAPSLPKNDMVVARQPDDERPRSGRGGRGGFEPELDSGWYKDKLDVGESIVLKPGVRNLRSAPAGWKVSWRVSPPKGTFVELVDIVEKPNGEAEIRLRGKAVGQESILVIAQVGPDDSREKQVGPFQLKVFPAGSNHGRKATPTPDVQAGQAGQADGTDALNKNRKKWIAAGRVSMQTEIVGLLNSIEKLKALRIDTWEKIASKEDAKPLKAALTVAVTIAGYGFGGVIGGLLTSKMAHGLAQEFVKEVAHKGSDKAIVASWNALVASSKSSLDKGTLEATQVAGDISDRSLQTKSDMLGAYAEAMRLFAIDEERKQATQFNLDAAGLDDIKLADKISVLSALYTELRNQPETFARELSMGLLRLKDEQFLEKEAKGHGGDRAKTEREDEDVHEAEYRSGNLLLLSEKVVGGSLGPWGNPDLSFSGFRGLGTGDTNTATFNALRGAKIEDLPFSVAFRFWAEDPFYRILKGGLIKVWFGRQPSGLVWVHNDLSENAEEWLASYYLRISDILSDADRKRGVQPGAKKLYDQIKGKPLLRAENFDVF